MKIITVKLALFIMLLMMLARSGVHVYRIITETTMKFEPQEELYKKIVKLYEKVE